MSNHTKAWAIVREVSDHDLRDELIAAHERILDAAEELEASDDLETGVYQATEWRDTLQDIAAKIDCHTGEIEVWVEDAIEKLAAVPKADSPEGETAEKLKEALERIEALEAERALLKAEVHQLEAAAHIPEDVKHAVGDVLAMSRKLTSFCEKAGIKPATLRVTRSKRKAG